MDLNASDGLMLGRFTKRGNILGKKAPRGIYEYHLCRNKKACTLSGFQNQLESSFRKHLWITIQPSRCLSSLLNFLGIYCLEDVHATPKSTPKQSFFKLF